MRRIRLTQWLAILVLGTAVPLLCFAGATLFKISTDAQSARDQGQADMVRALALALDGEVRTWKASLTALASSTSLRNRRYADFFEEALRVTSEYEGWAALTDSSGRQLLNTLRPYGTPLPNTAPEAIGTIFVDGQPRVADVFFGKVAQRHVISVVVPVREDGTVRYALEMVFPPERLSRLLERQRLPPAWLAAVHDRQLHVVAQSRGIERSVGQSVVPWLAAAERATNHGIGTGPLSDGHVNRITFQRLQEVPWTVALGVPTAEVPSNRPLVLFVLGGMAVALIAVGVAISTGRKVTAPVARMAGAGAAVVRGEVVDLGAPSGIYEVRALQQALTETAAAVQTYRDERKRAEEALRQAGAYTRSLIEASLDPLVTISPDGKITDVNAATEAVTGYPRADIIGTDFSDYFTEPMQARAGYEQVFREGVVRDYPLEILHRDGHVTSVLYNAAVYRDNAGKVTGVFAAARDVTARKRAEAEIHRLNAELEQRVVERTAQLHAANRELEASNKELEAFSYSVSHDLRAPLRAIDGFSRILVEEHAAELSADARRYLHLVRANTQQMGILVDDLLAFSRLGRQALRKETVRPGEIVQQALDELRSEREGPNLECLVGELSACQADPALLKQVWVNLLSNALKFTRQREQARIDIGCFQLQDAKAQGVELPPTLHDIAHVDPQRTVYFVRDNGVGFDRQYAHKLFGVFQRLHRAEEYEGTGVGLAIVQRIVHRHGGQIWADAKVGVGAAFYFTI